MKKITSSFIREHRTNLGMTQKDFADFLEKKIGRKITRDMIAQYEIDRAWVPGDIVLILQELSKNS